MEASAYLNDFFELKQVFTPDDGEIVIPGSGVKIMNHDFTSVMEPGGCFSNDCSISENLDFTYPIFVPPDETSKKVILLLHGLNERSWQKYLAWAYRLCTETGSYVILFPISFHINRSPASWVNPRLMNGPLMERNSRYSELRMSSFANIALSNRLTEDPMRFFSSGYQTATDIVTLMNQVKKGEIKAIPEGSRVNIFAYSIGAFLAQILMMGNPEGLFSESKLFMFCGGSVFSSMQGTSRLIMDSTAFTRVYNYYLHDFEESITRKNPFFELLSTSRTGIAFRSMIDISRFRSFRENILGKLKDQLRSIALLRDTVIPAEGILKTLAGGRSRNIRVDVWDFPYSYTHENPFPVMNDKISVEVNRWFDRMINEACLFFA